MIKCYVWSVLLYGVEAWTLEVGTINRLEAFEMWIHRRMLRISRTDMVSNVEVLRRANTDRQLFKTVKFRKTSYFGHIMTGEKYSILQLIIKGKIEGRRGVGRKQLSWLRNIGEWTGVRRVEDLFRSTQDRESFSRVMVNVGEDPKGHREAEESL